MPQLPASSQWGARSLFMLWLLVATCLAKSPSGAGSDQGTGVGQQEVAWVKPWAQDEPSARSSQPGWVAESCS